MIGRPTVDPALGDAVVRALAPFEDVAAAYLFGSVVRGRERPDSDLDVAVVMRSSSEGLAGGQAARAAESLARETGFERVDVVDLAAQGSIFAHAVLCEGALVLERDRARRVDFETDVVRDALDFRPTYELATRGKVAALRRWLEERYDL